MSSVENNLSDISNDDRKSIRLSQLQEKDFYHAWLLLQCGKIPDIFYGSLILRDELTEKYQSVASWPDPDSSMDAVTELAERVIKDKRGLITALESEPQEDSLNRDTAYILGYPVIVNDTIFAVATIAVLAKDKDALKHAMQQLEWGCGWLESAYWHQQATSHNPERLSSSVDLLARVLAEKTFNAAAVRLVTELALVFQCDRVSIGLIDGKSIKVSQISHSTQFGKKMNLVRCIEASMDEAVDQRKPITLPLIDDDAHEITNAHKELIELQDSISVMTIPLYLDYEVAGALTLERNSGESFDADDVDYCEGITALAISALNEKKENDRHVLIKVWDSLKKQLSYLLGKEHYLYKAVSIAVIATVLFLVFYQAEYRVSANAVLENEVRRSIVAPFAGYIDESKVRAGDHISRDQLMMNLDVKDLHLEKLKWVSQKEKLNRQYQESLSKHDRAKTKIINSQIAQAQAQLSLVEEQLSRAEIRAPFDGLVVKGDLSNRLGGVVEQGALLFEIAPENSYRVKLLVKQSRISDIALGKEGTLYLSALPNHPYYFSISKITPVTQAKEGETYFEVKAKLNAIDSLMQSGMEGVGKIAVDQRSLLSILMRDLIEWLRIQWWFLVG